MIVYVSIIFSIDIPMICLAIYAVYSLIKSKRAAPVFVMNLLISDLIQVVSELLLNVRNDYWWHTALITWTWTSLTGLYFMTCIAVERYILIAHPIWHRSHRSLKCLVCTSLNAENIIRTPHCCSRLKRVQTETGQTTSTDVQRDHVWEIHTRLLMSVIQLWMYSKHSQITH